MDQAYRYSPTCDEICPNFYNIICSVFNVNNKFRDVLIWLWCKLLYFCAFLLLFILYLNIKFVVFVANGIKRKRVKKKFNKAIERRKDVFENQIRNIIIIKNKIDNLFSNQTIGYLIKNNRIIQKTLNKILDFLMIIMNKFTMKLYKNAYPLWNAFHWDQPSKRIFSISIIIKRKEHHDTLPVDFHLSLKKAIIIEVQDIAVWIKNLYLEYPRQNNFNNQHL